MTPLVDASVLAELAKSGPSERALAWAKSTRRVYLSAITVEEVQRALARTASPDALAQTDAWFTQFLKGHCEVVPVTADFARNAGRLRVTLAQKGKHLNQTEAILAVTAIHLGVSLITGSPGVYSECDIETYNPL
jgi:predicted nucleic acid-binding protein